jgi:riboflavin synthase
MFTGIIEGLGKVSGIRSMGGGRRLAVSADFSLDGTKIGDSIAVNGACLTVVSLSGKRFEVDVSPETLDKTTLKDTTIGTRVNIERSLRLRDRLDGHLVSGHIDGTGTMARKTRQENAVIIGFSIPAGLADYMIPKGSVAVDGISLTINACDADGFEVSIIPHTAQVTTLGIKKIGDSVNIETDMIGKYVKKFLENQGKDGDRKPARGTGVDMAFLSKTGFI